MDNMATALGKTTEIEGPPAGSAAGQAASAAGAPGATGPTDFANPTTNQDLLLASASGFKEPFDAMGLKVGAGPGGSLAVLHADGSLASGAERAELALRISQEPMALMKRPDFFEVLPRDKFAGLKQAYGNQTVVTAEDFLHMGMTDHQRDFLWSASCDKVSGSCNRNAEEMSYRKGNYVPPEDLLRIAKRESMAANERFRKDAQRREDFIKEKLTSSHVSSAVGDRLARIFGNQFSAAVASFLDDPFGFGRRRAGLSGGPAPAVGTSRQGRLVPRAQGSPAPRQVWPWVLWALLFTVAMAAAWRWRRHAAGAEADPERQDD
jgi:hypothetical protein